MKVFEGRLDNARVVVRIVGMRLFAWIGYASFDDMSMTVITTPNGQVLTVEPAWAVPSARKNRPLLQMELAFAD
ncbi:hypothetical protein Tco_0116113 [Tanacetum coccineum]